MGLLTVTLHHVPADAEAEVRSLLAKHELERHDNNTEDLYDDDWHTYSAGSCAGETVTEALEKLGCAFELSTESIYDYTVMSDPELGQMQFDRGEGGIDTVALCEVEALAELNTIEEVRAAVGKLTGAAWNEKFAAYEAAREQGN